jgi:drug/metabolite transporter (DMT)-like permease
VADTTILNATVLVNTIPIFSMFISSFVFKLRPSRIALLGLMISFFGVCIIGHGEMNVAGSALEQAGHGSTLKGDLEAVLAATVESFCLNYGK